MCRISEARRLDAHLLLPAQAGDDFGKIILYAVQARDVSLRVLVRPDRMIVDERVRDGALRTAHLADRVAMVAPAEQRKLLFRIAGEQAVIELRLRSQCLVIECLQFCKITARQRGILELARLAHVVPLVLVGLYP